MKSILFIQGVFFQEREYLSIGFDERIGERVAIDNAMFQTMFSGVLGASHEDAEYGEGMMLDIYGASSLSEVKMTESELSFKKTYHHRFDVISYAFTRDEETGSWIGTYEGRAVGKGITRCMTSPAEIFYDLKDLMKRLEKKG